MFFSNVRWFLFSFALLSFSCSYGYAGVANDAEALRLETEAGKLAKQWNGDSIRRSIALYDIASREWAKSNNQRREAFCLRESIRLSFLVSPSTEIHVHAKKALKLSEKIGDTDGTVDALGLLVRLNANEGKWELVKSYLKRALRKSETSGSLRTKAEINLLAGETYFDYAQPDFALMHLKTAQSLANQLDDDELTASIFLNLGITHSVKAENEQAISLLSKAFIIWDKKQDKRGLARIYNAIAFVDSISNKKQDALKSFSKAEEMIPPGVDYLEQAKSANGIAAVLTDYGQMDLAEAAHERALIAFRNANNFLGQVATLPDIAKHVYRKGNYEKSVRLLNEAIELAGEADHDYFKAIAQQTLGDIELSRGNTETAITIFKKTLSVFSTGENYLAILQNKLGAAYEKNGEALRARILFADAARGNRKTRDSIHLADSLFRLARNSISAHKTDTALEEIKESISITESLYHDVSNGRLRQSFLSDVFDRYDLLIRVLMEKHKQVPDAGFDLQALQASEKGRSRKMLENVLLSDSDIRADARPELVKLENDFIGRLSLRKQHLTQLIGAGAPEAEIKKVELEIAQIDFRLKEVLAKIERFSPVYSAITTPYTLDINAFRRSLDNETLVIEFAMGEEESYVWVIEKAQVKSYTLPGREQIERQTDRLRLLISSRNKADSESIRDFQFRLQKEKELFESDSRQLSTTLLGQFAEKLRNKRLVIISDGKLNYFPFSALPFPNREAKTYQPLLISNEIVYQPSATLSFVISNQERMVRPAAKDLLVFSDAVYAFEDPRIQKKSTSRRIASGASLDSTVLGEQITDSLDPLRRLSGAGREADSIISYFDPERITVASGFAASREGFLRSGLESYKILHFATHGVLNETRPELSGLVLSKFRNDGLPIDGFVRLSDIYRKNLVADLVVLSACDTANGEDVKGEGLMSLTNGFLQIGARTVISSRWKADDRATLHLMRAFYKRVAMQDLTPAESLRQAQIELYESGQYSSPHFWATFATYGDYLNKPQLSPRFNLKGFGLIVGLFMAGFLGLVGLRMFQSHKYHSTLK